MDAPPKPGRTVAFPCIENPFRVSLYCNGNYLWCLNRGGKAGTRKRRAIDRDDFQLIETDGGTSVMIVNHKFGSVLSAVKNKRGVTRIRFISQEGMPEEESGGEMDSQEGYGDDESLACYQQEIPAASSTESLEPTESMDGTEDDNDDDDDLTNADISIECQKWQFLESLDGYVCMQNVGTGDRLGVDKRGRCTLFSEDDPVGVHNLWIVEPVTGELCFLSNAKTDSRLRCDMVGKLGMSSNWKGWEVFRFLEAGNGYVKICSWTHSLWILKCHASGKIQTGRHSDFHTDQDWCSLWAVESAPDGKGVVIRSKSFERFLCVRKNGNALVLGTYHPFDDVDDGTDSDCFSKSDDDTWYGGDISMSQSEDSCGVNSPSHRSQEAYIQEALDRRNRTERSNEQSNQRGIRRRWFRRRNNSEDLENGNNGNGNVGTLAGESIFWNLEAAHQQVYFMSAQPSETQGNITIGPFPRVSRNHRRTDKFCVIRRTMGDNKDTNDMVAQLLHIETEQYIACCEDGTVKLTLKDDESTEWMMTSSDAHGHNSFQSKLFGYYLSYTNIEDPLTGETIDGDSESVVSKLESPAKGSPNKRSPSKRSPSRLGGLFRGRSRDAGDEIDSELVGYKELSKNGYWDLGPSVPRALNSRKVRKFAFGTSLVLGSSLALPFALVGVGAVLHVGGHASVAYHVVVAGLSSADTVTSVGAVGATAYFVFRAQGVSLSDRANDPNGNGSEQDRSRFQRPFCEWRNWIPAQDSS
ncbi:unnamed protein product [Cylindrotheca closterium]|uniref:Uncharacterized protein n=1 Tax=Cylindrotheca closterium TaxID=2856 RepID=A0AAD2GEJ9_9STRA|nr:unnamed protein product [Cylindrotheca closterium]